MQLVFLFLDLARLAGAKAPLGSARQRCAGATNSLRTARSGYSSPVKFCGLCIALVLFGAGHRAWANDGGAVLLVDPPEGLEKATRTALDPWNIEIEVVSGMVLEPIMPDSSDAARALAKEHDARAVIWIGRSAKGSSLWAYDSKDDRVVVRRLSPEPPFDAASAAAVALSIKTLLRHSDVAPKEQRFGSQAPKPITITRDFRFEALGAGRYTDSEAESTQLRLGLGLAYRWHGGLEVHTQLRLGTGLEVGNDAISGHFSDLTWSAGLRYLFDVGALQVGPTAALSLHFSSIEGTLPGGANVSASRVNPSVDLGGMARYWLSERIGLGVDLQAAVLLQRQRYLVGGEPVLTLPLADWEGGVWVFLPFH